MIAPMQKLARGVLALLALMFMLACGVAHAQTGLQPSTPTPTLAAPPPDDEPPYYDASFVSQSVPASMVAGSTYNVSVTMRNSGTTTWVGAYGDGLGAVNPVNNTIWGANRATLGGSVGPSGQVTFNFQVTAPAAAGTYNFQWQMAADSDLWFGAATPNVVVTVAAPAPVNNATIISQSVPATMTSGQSYPVSVTVQNTGNTTWTAASGYALGSQNPQDNQIWGIGRVSLGASVAPGQQYTFTFNVTAPAAGAYSMQWKMLKEGVQWFGQTMSAPVTVNVPAPVNNATIVSQSVPAAMTSGQSYPVTVTVQNTGTSTWTTAYALGSQNPQDNQTWGIARIFVGAPVAPGQQYTFSFNVTAPAAGNYNMQWKVLSTVEWFGQTMGAPVAVAAQAPTDVVTYIHTDGLGSPVARSDAAGNLISRTRYEPYGGTASGETPTIGFTGHVNDADTGLVYMQQRYYDPVAGRFLSIDPVTTDANTGGSFNRYAYANNSPYNYTDPDGRCADHYNDGGCKVAVDSGTGAAGTAAGKQLEGVLNKYDKAVNALGDKSNFKIKDWNGKVVGSMTGKEIKAVWNGTHFTVTNKAFNNGGAGGGTGGTWTGDSFSGNSELSPRAVSAYANAATARNEDADVGLSTLTFHELGHETHYGEALTRKYPVTPSISWPREHGASSAGARMSGAVGAPFDCSIPGGCQ